MKLLLDLKKQVSKVKYPTRLFTDWQRLLGFDIGWLRPRLADELCHRHGFAPEECEVILMQAHGRTDCHVHERGTATFLVLGREHGFADPCGGVLLADYSAGQNEYVLRPHYQEGGELLTVPAGKVHAFFADPGSEFNALAFVQPRIRAGDAFDAVEFQYVEPIAAGGPITVMVRN